MMVDSTLGLGVHVTQKLGISEVLSISLGPSKEVKYKKHVHGFADIVFIPTSTTRTAAMTGSECESETAYVNALASDWPSFIHESRGWGYLGRVCTKAGWGRATGMALNWTDGGRGRILDAVRKIPILAQRTTFACIRL